MPTINPRISVTLSVPLSLVLKRLSELTGDSQSRLIGEILGESLPVFERMVHVLEAAERAKEAVRTTSSERLAAAQSQIEGQLGLVWTQFDELTGSVLADVENVERRSRRKGDAPPRKAQRGAGRRPVDAKAIDQSQTGQGSAGSTPRGAPTPISNRGVRSLTNTVKKTSRRVTE